MLNGMNTNVLYMKKCCEPINACFIKDGCLEKMMKPSPSNLPTYLI